MSEIPNKFEFEGMNFNYDTRPNKYFFDYSHITWIQKRKNIGKTLKCLPFPGSIYTLYTGDNFSLISGKHGLNRRIVRMLTPSFKPTKKIKNRFCLEN